MKPILGFAALLAWLTHCPDNNLPGHGGHPQHGPGHHTLDAGPDETPDAGEDAALSEDAAISGKDAAVCSEDAAIPIEDAGLGVDASEIDEPDSAVIEEPPLSEPIPDGECHVEVLELYLDGYCDEGHLRPGIKKYIPKYQLWSDGAKKDRYYQLPADGSIDTTEPDRWRFPDGTKFWKMFSVKGKRIETRRLTKINGDMGIASWTTIAYAWSEDQRTVTEADAMNGVVNALNSGHDIPTKAQCVRCHTMTKKQNPMDPMSAVVNLDAVNGFSAIQLSWQTPPPNDGPERPVTLAALNFRGLLRNGVAGVQNVTEGQAQLPGDGKAQAALGYLHANCGHCHGGATPRAGLALIGQSGMKDPTKTSAFALTCGKCLTSWWGKPNTELGNGAVYTWRIKPGSAAESGIVGRMSAVFPTTDAMNNPAADPTLRSPKDQMPPLGTSHIDPAGIEALRTWIDSLDPNACELTAVCPAPPPPMMAMGMAGAPAPAPAPAPTN